MKRSKGTIDPVRFTIDMVKAMESDEPFRLVSLVNDLLYAPSSPASPNCVTPAQPDIKDAAKDIFEKYIESHPEILTQEENDTGTQRQALSLSSGDESQPSVETSFTPQEPAQEQQPQEDNLYSEPGQASDQNRGEIPNGLRQPAQQVSVELGPQVIDTNEYIFIRVRLPSVTEEKDIGINIFPYYASVRLKALGYEQVIPLPSDSDCDNASAGIGDGILEIKIPRCSRQDFKQLRIHR